MSDINYEAHPEYASYGNWEDLAAAQKKEIERLRSELAECECVGGKLMEEREQLGYEIKHLQELVNGTIDRNSNLASENARLREEKGKAYDNGFIVGTQKAPSYKENQELRDEIERLRGLLDSSRPFVAFHTIELRELLEHPLPPTALPGAIEAVKLRITELEKLEADIEQTLDKRHYE